MAISQAVVEGLLPVVTSGATPYAQFAGWCKAFDLFAEAVEEVVLPFATCTERAVLLASEVCMWVSSGLAGDDEDIGHPTRRNLGRRTGFLEFLHSLSLARYAHYVFTDVVLPVEVGCGGGYACYGCCS